MDEYGLVLEFQTEYFPRRSEFECDALWSPCRTAQSDLGASGRGARGPHCRRDGRRPLGRREVEPTLPFRGDRVPPQRVLLSLNTGRPTGARADRTQVRFGRAAARGPVAPCSPGGQGRARPGEPPRRVVIDRDVVLHHEPHARPRSAEGTRRDRLRTLGHIEPCGLDTGRDLRRGPVPDPGGNAPRSGRPYATWRSVHSDRRPHQDRRRDSRSR